MRTGLTYLMMRQMHWKTKQNLLPSRIWSQVVSHHQCPHLTPDEVRTYYLTLAYGLDPNHSEDLSVDSANDILRLVYNLLDQPENQQSNHGVSIDAFEALMTAHLASFEHVTEWETQHDWRCSCHRSSPYFRNIHPCESCARR